MITASTPHTINTVDIKTTNKYKILNAKPETYTYNIGYYDDTAVKHRLDLLESAVTDIQGTDVNFQYRLSLLEAHENDWATHSDINSLDRRVTRLENIPVGLTENQMDDILES